MPWYLYLALKQLFPSGGRRVSFFLWVSVLGVALGVMILVIVQSVMGGFGQTYRAMIVDTNGHARVESGAVLHGYASVLKELRADHRVAAAAPYGQGIVMVQHLNRPAFPFIRGIDPDPSQQVSPLGRFMVVGEVSDLDDDSVLVSSVLARELGLRLGDVLDLYTPLMLERLKEDEILLPREMRVAGIYETGWNQFDSNTLVSTLRTLQELYNLQGGVHGLAVRLHPGFDEHRFASDWNSTLSPPLRMLTWMHMFQDFLWVLQLEKTMMLFLLLFIVLVAAFAIAVAQLLTVLRKTREIGLLGAVGAKPWQLAAVYCLQGGFIGVSGTALGIVLAVLALAFRDSIIHGLTLVFGGRDALIKFYQFANLPVHYALPDFLIIALSAITLATMAGLIPAWRAARLRPADALRAE